MCGLQTKLEWSITAGKYFRAASMQRKYGVGSIYGDAHPRMSSSHFWHILFNFLIPRFFKARWCISKGDWYTLLDLTGWENQSTLILIHSSRLTQWLNNSTRYKICFLRNNWKIFEVWSLTRILKIIWCFVLRLMGISMFQNI